MNTRITFAAVAVAIPSLLCAQDQPGATLPPLQKPGTDYRTPRAGEGFTADLFGSPYEVQPRDRHSVSALDVGFQVTPDVSDSSFQPYASWYLFDRAPNGSEYTRALLGGIYDDVQWARKLDAHDDMEMVLGFTNYTPPYEIGEWIDGDVIDGEKLKWGYVRGRIGFGARTDIGPGHPDNMSATDVFLEPGYLYFGRGDSTDPSFELPDSTFEMRVRLQTRHDALERNLVERAHSGYAWGGDVIWGTRSGWSTFGAPTGTGTTRGGDSRDYVIASAYFVDAMPLPFTDSERHRLVFTAHAAVSDGTDRFSAPRIGGGPDTRGEEFESIAHPVLPGAGIEEFYPEHYAIGSLTYRYEATFFAYFEAGATVAWLDRDRRRGGGIARDDDTLTSLHAMVTSGFLGQTRLQFGYAYDFDLVRDGEDGGSSFGFRITKTF
ncbi:MAG: hypothetical protein U1F36_22020 [Planctomycetota bacterium]